MAYVCEIIAKMTILRAKNTAHKLDIKNHSLNVFANQKFAY